jgi:hypothetical protein
MKIDGSCLCGSIEFEAEMNPMHVFVCHCTDCQTHSGTAFRTVARTTPGSFHLLKGTLKNFQKTAESGNRRSLAFCPECGTSIYGGPGDGEEGPMSVRVGTLRQRDQLRPRVQVWARSAQPWVEELGEITHIEMQGAAAEPT